MTIQPITYNGRTLAACTPRRVYLSAEIEALEPDHPLRLFVLGMCLYAGEILNGHRPGPYTDHDARAHVRRMLLPVELGAVAETCQDRRDPCGRPAADGERAVELSERCGGRRRRGVRGN